MLDHLHQCQVRNIDCETAAEACAELLHGGGYDWAALDLLRCEIIEAADLGEEEKQEGLRRLDEIEGLSECEAKRAAAFALLSILLQNPGMQEQWAKISGDRLLGYR